MWKLLLTQCSDAVWVRRPSTTARRLRVLVLRYERKAHAVARAARVPNAKLEDLVQDSFLKAFENLPRLRRAESFGSWFLSIVRNAARRSLRCARGPSTVPLPENLGAAATPPSSGRTSDPFGVAIPEDRGRSTGDSWRRARRCPSGTDGAYRIAGLEDGDHRLLAAHNDFLPPPTAGRWWGRSGRAVRPPLPGPRELLAVWSTGGTAVGAASLLARLPASAAPARRMPGGSSSWRSRRARSSWQEDGR